MDSTRRWLLTTAATLLTAAWMPPKKRLTECFLSLIGYSPDGATITVSLTARPAARAKIVQWHLSWGDGQTIQGTGAPPLLHQAHTYATEGAKSLVLTVWDSLGGTAGATLPAKLVFRNREAQQAGSVIAPSGSIADIQATINAATTGTTVIVPNGSYTWTSGSITISGKAIHLRGESQAGVLITCNTTNGIVITEDASLYTHVSHFTVVAGSTGRFIFVSPLTAPTNTGQMVHVHNLTVNQAAGIRCESNHLLVYDCAINGPATVAPSSPNHIFVQCTQESMTNSWLTPSTMGMADTNGDQNIYIEDCAFTRVLAAAMDTDANSRVVIRNNTFDQSATSSHGADTGPYGCRHWEYYDNTFIFTNFGDNDGSLTSAVPYFIFLRGGTGIIADNDGLEDMSSTAYGSKPAVAMTVMNLRRDAGPNGCWGMNLGGVQYPSPRQIGMGRVTGTAGNDSITYVGDSEPIYIWNQPGMAVSLQDYGEATNLCVGSVDTVTDYVQLNRDYFYSATSAGAKPGYTKYTYPHPLRAS